MAEKETAADKIRTELLSQYLLVGSFSLSQCCVNGICDWQVTVVGSLMQNDRSTMRVTETRKTVLDTYNPLCLTLP